MGYDPSFERKRSPLASVEERARRSVQGGQVKSESTEESVKNLGPIPDLKRGAAAHSTKMPPMRKKSRKRRRPPPEFTTDDAAAALAEPM